jgi:hypothetical protein
VKGSNPFARSILISQVYFRQLAGCFFVAAGVAAGSAAAQIERWAELIKP